MSQNLVDIYYGQSSCDLCQHETWSIDAVSTPGKVVWNFQSVAVALEINDLRGYAQQPTLDAAGFQMIKLQTLADQEGLYARDASALQVYLTETESLLKSITDADRVHFFDATLREENTDKPCAPGFQGAHRRAHVDQNPTSARARAARHASRESYQRLQIINVWRPILQVVSNYPLAFCDYRSLDLAADLVPTRLVFPATLADAENFSLRYNPRHQWSYWKNLTPDEALLFKCYDSASRSLAFLDGHGDGPNLKDIAGLCPHSAFFDADAPTEGLLRISLEVRALLFHG